MAVETISLTLKTTVYAETTEYWTSLFSEFYSVVRYTK